MQVTLCHMIPFSCIDMCIQMMLQVHDLDALNDELHAEVHDVNLLRPDNQLAEMEELKEHYSRYSPRWILNSIAGPRCTADT